MMPINPPNSAKVLKFSLDPHTKRRGNLCQLPVPHPEALALPDIVERATRDPRRI